MSCQGLLLLCAVLVAVSGNEATDWCVYTDKYLGSYTSGVNVYDSLDTAKENCLVKADCFGITQQGLQRFTLRKDWVIRDSPSGEISYVPCGGLLTCTEFGLKSVHGKFLSAQSDGTVDWNREYYGDWEKVYFEQWGKDSGFLRSHHGTYLAATFWHTLEWDRSWKRGWELFKVFKHEDKIALKTAHGKYVSAQPDGTVYANEKHANEWEWFEMYPQSCLNSTECDCSRGVDSINYILEDMVYDMERAKVHSYPPETVGYQHIDNQAGSTEQSTTFTVSETRTETVSFTHTAGASVTVGVEFTVGVPSVAQGKVSLDLTVSYEFSYGKTHSEENTVVASYNCNAPPGKQVECEVLLYQYRTTIPYEQVWRHKRLPCSCQSSGVFREVSAHEMRLSITEE